MAFSFCLLSRVRGPVAHFAPSSGRSAEFESSAICEDAFDMAVLIAFFFCMGEEQNLSNSTAFQIASPRLSNNH